MADDFRFLGLTLENMRAFGPAQKLDLAGLDGAPARWCVILGENGVGKTTTMQALAMMRPVPAFKRGDDGQVIALAVTDGDLPDPDFVEPDVFDYDNERIEGLVRRHADRVSARMTAVLRDTTGREIEIGFDCVVENGELQTATLQQQHESLKAEGPLIIGYGASRHLGSRNMNSVSDNRPTEGLFNDLVELVDADEVMEFLHHAELSARVALETDAGNEELRRDHHRVSRFFGGLKNAIAKVIPHLEPADISIVMPRLTGSTSRTGMRVRTASGEVPMAELSLGYRVTISWIVDLAWTLFQRRPDSPSPFDESAIVLVDEIDLHLHPRWQREIRHHLLDVFKNVQFIVTSHSPIIAQEGIAQGDPVSVVRLEGDHATILNRPLPSKPWRYDEVLGSRAFNELIGADLRSEALLIERRALLRKRELTPEEDARLDALNAIIHDLQAPDAPYDAAFDKLMGRVVELEKQLAAKS
ncbi:AAA family ATPase [Caulobacter soli]|uniref:AAA family ATPase n=1 Tax=Caulobacter soli TaxID=2708539 RepID=UPI0013ECE7FD|nr:AAA family ATPase [Caulobacter soli]